MRQLNLNQGRVSMDYLNIRKLGEKDYRLMDLKNRLRRLKSMRGSYTLYVDDDMIEDLEQEIKELEEEICGTRSK